MKRLCVEDIKLDNSIFVRNCEYEVDFHPYRAGVFLITDAMGFTTEIALSIFQQYFI